MNGGQQPPVRDDPSVALDALLREIASEFPSFQIVYKRDSRFSKLIDLVLRLVTFGAQSEYLSRYHTVIGNTLYVPASWDSTSNTERLITLCHERVHLRQRRRYGDFLMTFLYLVPFFPLGLAYGRARIEWEAYAETLRQTAHWRGVEAAASSAMRDYIVRQFCSGAYGWMWPFKEQVNRWFDTELSSIRERSDRS